MNSFYKDFFLFFGKSINNFYPKNFDYEIRKLGFRRKAMLFFEIFINKAIAFISNKASILLISKNNYYLNKINEFEFCYNLLNDEPSRKKYIELLAYRVLGFTKVKLSLNNEHFWIERSKIESYKRPERIPVDFRSGYLDLYDLTNAGYQLKLFFVNNGIYVDFILEQYNYHNLVCVSPGDVVIDAGGCWGDTALYFAAKGASKVYVFEFIPSNIAIMQKNIALNNQFSSNISLVENAVWDKSGVELSYKDKGPSSRVDKAGVFKEKTLTLSIDDLVTNQGIPSVDFIKMDIEGAELQALKGAEDTIRKFKPKLAISVYHKHDDLILIPSYIQSINPNYEFYLDYYTIVGDEIMLYAISKNDN